MAGAMAEQATSATCAVPKVPQSTMHQILPSDCGENFLLITSVACNKENKPQDRVGSYSALNPTNKPAYALNVSSHAHKNNSFKVRLLNNITNVQKDAAIDKHLFTCNTLSPVVFPILKPPSRLWPQVSKDDNNNGTSSSCIPAPSLKAFARKSLSLRRICDKVDGPFLSVKSDNFCSPSPKISEALKATSLSLPQETTKDANASPSDRPDVEVVEDLVHASQQSVQPLSLSAPIFVVGEDPTSQEVEQPTLTSTSDPELLQRLLEETLPQNYSHKVVTVVPLHVYHKADFDQSTLYQAVIRINISCKSEALQWLADYQVQSCTDWRVRRTFPENTDRLVFKKSYRCHNNTLAQNRPGTKAHSKNTECRASLTLSVKNPKMKRSKDEFLKTHPFEVTIDHCHNHPLDSVESLCFRRPKSKVVEKFHDFFRNRHSPSSALQTHLFDIRVEYPENWFEIQGDRAECPSLQWCFYQYYKLYKNAYGDPDGEGMLKSLHEAVDKYNSECGSVCAAVKEHRNDLIVVICSPFMKRVHKYLKASGEIGFLDSGGCMDRQNTRIFTFLTASVAGALPTGVIMVSSEAEEVLFEGMTMLKAILPENAFYGKNMPPVMMTDDSAAERNALRRSFPGIKLLLCLFHVLNAFWRYIWDGKHEVPSEDKEEVFFLFKTWCYCDDKDKFEQTCKDLLGHPKIKNNSFVVKQIKGYYARKEEWALCYRTVLLIRGNNTDNYSERTIRSYKDDILGRIKAYSIVQLFDFFTSRGEAYFEMRIAMVLNNRKANHTQSKHFIDPKKLLPLESSRSQFDGLYCVTNLESGGKYFVDMDLEVCSCPVGKNGAPCKHQQAVSKKFNLSTSQFLPFHDVQAKLALHQIMTTVAPRPGWYAPLKGGPELPPTPVASETPETGEENIDGSGDDMAEAVGEESHYGDTEAAVREGSDSSDSTNCISEEQSKALSAWNSIEAFVRNGLNERPEVFITAVQKFCERFEKTKNLSENAVLSSMHTFNENNNIGLRAYKKGRYINVNKIQVSRRKVALGGRKCAPQGRPRKTAFTSEHGYSSQRPGKGLAWNVRPSKRTALPHSLSHQIQSSISKKARLG